MNIWTDYNQFANLVENKIDIEDNNIGLLLSSRYLSSLFGIFNKNDGLCLKIM